MKQNNKNNRLLKTMKIFSIFIAACVSTSPLAGTIHYENIIEFSDETAYSIEDHRNSIGKITRRIDHLSFRELSEDISFESEQLVGHGSVKDTKESNFIGFTQPIRFDSSSDDPNELATSSLMSSSGENSFLLEMIEVSNLGSTEIASFEDNEQLAIAVFEPRPFGIFAMGLLFLWALRPGSNEHKLRR